MVAEIVKLREKEPDRPIFQVGINGLIDGLAEPLSREQLHQWWDLPTGSIIMIDEAQESHLMPKDNGNVPEWIRRMSKVRHVGMDFYLTSQRPAFISSYVRGLVDRHVHFIRKFNTGICQRFTWGSCSENPRSRAEQKIAVEDVIALPRQVFALYKSANAHNMKRKLPRKLFVLGAMALVAVAAIVAVPYRLKALRASQLHAVDGDTSASASSSTAPLARKSEDPSAVDDSLRRTDYAKWQRPRVAGIPWTAPMFDNLAVTAQPRLACMALEDGTCKCVTEQGTDFDVPVAMCRQIALHGLYNPFAAPANRDDENRQASRSDDRSKPDGTLPAVQPVTSMVADSAYHAGVGSQSYIPPQLEKPLPDDGLKFPKSHQ